MSDASKNKQKSRKTNGWEEAGCEFYQENYCAEWDGFAKNPMAITTLLPSKQNRLGTCKRNYTQRDRKHKICWQQLTSTGPRNYQQNEGQFSLLPDLSQVINDEEHIWEEMFQIKQLPLSMHQKKEFKSDLQSATKLRLQGFNQLKWKHRKAWQKIALEWSKFSATIKLWQSSLKQIEGHFGSGVAAYFIFLRWLFYLNCITFLLIVIFVITPNILTREQIVDRCKLSPNVNYSSNCLTEIADRNTYVDSKNRESFSILDLVQGTGILEVSLMFYGGYSNKRVGIALKESHNSTHSKSEHQVLYDLSSAYIFAVLGYFTTTLIFIVKASAREFKDRLINGRWQFYQYCNLAFGGWDFCIHNEKSSIIKHKAVFNEFKNSIHSKRIEVERNNRSNDYMLKLIMIRIIVNFAVVIILILSAYIIFLLFNMSLQQGYGKYTNVSYIEVNSLDFAEVKEPSLQLLELFYDFAPYVSIVCLNLVLPVFFKYLCSFEKYSPMFVIKISLIRMIFLRLASLFILLSRFYYIVIPNSESNISNFTSYKCWETFVGQQFYKLVLTDFVSHLFVTFCFNLPRAILAIYFDSNNFVKFVCEQEFELSKHALDIVYLQTICWIGSFYMPFLPALTIVITFLMFYVKKFQCLVNSKPTKILYGTSRSNSLFMFVLLISFIVSVIVLTYAFSEVTPSVACGPFRGLKTVWDAPLSTFMGMPAFFKEFVFFFGTPGFVIPCFFVLTLLLYYFYAVSDANKNMVEVLKNQLVLEGHDKKFLLTRLLLTHQETQE